MFKNADAVLQRVLELVAKCPKEFQEKCFELLLSGYVQIEVAGTKPHTPSGITGATFQTEQRAPDTESPIPPAALTRFKNTAKRIDVPLQKLEAIFDFSVDPFALQAVSVPGKKKAEKTRLVALLAASRSYLATGSWCADWQEVKSLCVDQNCYDAPNHAVNLKNGANGARSLFKNVESGNSFELCSNGIQEAEKLLKRLAEGATE